MCEPGWTPMHWSGQNWGTESRLAGADGASCKAREKRRERSVNLWRKKFSALSVWVEFISSLTPMLA